MSVLLETINKFKLVIHVLPLKKAVNEKFVLNHAKNIFRKLLSPDLDNKNNIIWSRSHCHLG